MFEKNVLENQVILITGGGTGLGKAMSERMASLGARVGIVGRREQPLTETTAAISASGGRCDWQSCDVRDRDDLGHAIDHLEAKLGQFTGLVNNAAGNFLSPSEDLSPNAFDAVVKIVLYGSFNATMELGTRWIERQHQAHVLSIVTTYSWMGSPFVLPSACAKAGVLAMARSLAVEWGVYGIRHNTIAPGPFPTEGAFSRLMPPGMLEHARLSNPLQRFGQPAELADLAVYLFSPAASYLNGECITIDGGEWLKNGQEFSGFVDAPRDRVKSEMRSLRPASKPKQPT